MPTARVNQAQHIRSQVDCEGRVAGIRVLVLLGGIPLHGQERGNIEVIRAMTELGLEAKFITHAKWGHLYVQPALTRFGFQWTTAAFGPRLGTNLFGLDFLRSLFGMLRTNYALWREVRRWHPTHLYTMNWFYFFYALPTIAWLRLPLVYRLGDCPPQSTFLHRWLWRVICRRTTSLVCISDFMRSELESSSGEPPLMRVIRNVPPRRHSIDMKAPSSAICVAPSKRIIIYVGQITEEKGVSILVKAGRELLKQGYEIVVLLVGEHEWQNPMAEALNKELHRDRLHDKIQFLGYRDDISSLMRLSYLHVCPSMCREALGNVVLEAKASAIPSVVFPDGGLPELIEHKHDGFVCADKSVAALVDGLRWFLDHPAEQERAGQAAKESLDSRFSFSRFQEEWAQVFLQTWEFHLPSQTE